MATIRGLSGFLAFGGLLLGAAVIDTTVSAGASVLSLVAAPGNTLRGVLVLGDQFAVSGVAGTYTVTAPILSRYFAGGNAITNVAFSPVAAAQFPAGAAFTITSKAVVNLKRWQADVTLQALDTSHMRQPARTRRTGHKAWTAQALALFDYDDPGQQVLVNALLSATEHVIGFVTLGAEDGVPPMLLYESCLVVQAQAMDPLDDLVTLGFNLISRERGYRALPLAPVGMVHEPWEYTNVLNVVPEVAEPWEYANVLNATPQVAEPWEYANVLNATPQVAEPWES